MTFAEKRHIHLEHPLIYIPENLNPTTGDEFDSLINTGKPKRKKKKKKKKKKKNDLNLFTIHQTQHGSSLAPIEAILESGSL